MNLLDDLRIFIRVAETGSFTEAARLSKLTPGVVSTRIKRLESYLCARLFFRSTRFVRLTPEGKLLLDESVPIVKTRSPSEDFTAHETRKLSGYVRVLSSTELVRFLIIPALQELWKESADISIEFIHPEAGSSSEFIDSDVVVLPNLAGWPHEQIAELGKHRIIVAATPAYLEANGTPQHPSDLNAHRCLPYVDLATGAVVEWVFERGGAGFRITPPSRLLLDQSDCHVDAALTGEGLIQAPDFVLHESIQSGALQPVLGDWTALGAPLHALSRRAPGQNPAADRVLGLIAQTYPVGRPLISSLRL